MSNHVPHLNVPYASLADILRARACQQPNQRGYTFLSEGESGDEHLTYGELDMRARAIAAKLQSVCAAGERALLLYPPGLEYIAAFFGCLYAGVVAVPVYPPNPARLERAMPRLSAIIQDARPVAALTTSSILHGVNALSDRDQSLQAMCWIATDQLDDAMAEFEEPCNVDSDILAFLQYTSGSTASPKGVMVTHGNLSHNSALIASAFGHSPASRGLIWLPPYHDMGLIGGILQPLYSGFPVTLMSPVGFLQKPLRWLEAISKQRATTSGGPNFAYDLCVRHSTPKERAALDLSCWNVAFTGAEPVRQETLERFAEAFAPSGFRREALYPCYGLAESTLIVSGGHVGLPPVCRAFFGEALKQNRVVESQTTDPDTQTFIGCGQAVGDQEIVIADSESRARCEPGQVGEIWVKGPSVAQGYWGRADQTLETFQAYLTDNGAGPYLRTGDLGFFQGGELFITGRIKDLIIIRGRNHYPQDIELTVEACHSALRPDCGAAFSVELDGEERLVVVQELDRQARNPDIAAIANSVRQAVAAHHELQVWAVVLIKTGHIPKTSSGKIQRHACRSGFVNGTLAIVGSSVLDSPIEPIAQEWTPSLTRESLLVLPLESRASALELYLCERVAQVLKIALDRLDTGESLASFGLDSLMAIELQHGIEADLGVNLAMVAFLEGPSIRQLARQVCEILIDADCDGQAPVIQARDMPNGAPLSFPQEQLWFLDQLDPGSPAYNIAVTLNLTGALNQAAMCGSLNEIVRRHESLRTTFILQNDRPVQTIAGALEIGLLVIDLSGFPAADRLHEAQSLALAESRRPFDLARGPLLRAALLRLADTAHVLLVTMHHIVSDGWSMGVLIKEMAALYAAFAAGKPSPLPPLTIQYADFSHWQREQAPSLFSNQTNYWREQLSGAPTVLRLPTDRPRPPVRTGHGATMRHTLPASLRDGLDTISRREGATLFMTLLAGFQVLIARYTGQEDFLVGTRINGRAVAQTEGLIGFFINALVLRGDLRNDPAFPELLRRTRAACLGAYANQDVPFDRVVEELHVERDLSRHPCFQVMFVLQNFPMPTLEMAGLSLTTSEVDNGTSKFDLDFALRETENGVSVAVEYNTDLFDANTIRRMLGHYQTLLEGIIAEPETRVSQLPVLTEAERGLMLVDWNATETAALPTRCLHELFADQVARYPNALAVECEGESLTYSELDTRANQCAHHLQSLGVGPDSPVAVCLERSLNTMVALLGILKAGGAYVPLDPTYPPAQLAFMLADTRAPVVITVRELSARLGAKDASIVCLDTDRDFIAHYPGIAPVTAATMANLSHIMYTSGSTGRPKGVMVPQRQLLNRFAWMWRAYPFTKGEVACQRTTMNFSPSLWEFLGPLLWGIPTVILPDAVVKDPVRLIDSLALHGVTRILLVPSLLRMLLDTDIDLARQLPKLTLWITAGEPLSGEIYRRFRERLPNAALVNDYGATEVHGVLAYDAPRDACDWETVPIGRPIDNIKVYLLDRGLQPVPIGVPGELHIASIGLAHGYENRSDLTAQQFIPNPFSPAPGARLYKTGDMARYLPDGSVEYLGRRDLQVKIRGIRIEVEGIETVIREHLGVAQAVVAAREDVPGDKRLIAYIVPSHKTDLTVSELQTYLKNQMPEFLIPSAIVILEELPRLPNGKVDRLGLPAPEGLRPSIEAVYVAPRNEVEQTISAILQEILQVDKVGIHDNFFDLGGHSLLLVQAINKLRVAFDKEIPLVELFKHPTVHALADYLLEEHSVQPTFEQSTDRAETRRNSLAQQRQQRQRHRTERVV